MEISTSPELSCDSALHQSEILGYFCHLPTHLSQWLCG